MSDGVSGFARALAALGTAGVDFVVVGVGGINFYARTPADAFATLDIDAFLAPAVENLRIALSTLAALGYEFEAGGEPSSPTRWTRCRAPASPMMNSGIRTS